MSDTRQQLHPEYLQILSNAAAVYAARNIPIVGVPGALASGDNAKNPGGCHTTWGRGGFTPDQLEDNPMFGGLAVVTGQDLIAVDIDTPEKQAIFETACADLLDTTTEVTALRQMPRYFYIPPHNVKLTSRKVPGLELLANGRVAVVWPTIIDGKAYTIRNRAKPRELSPDEWNRIQSLFDVLAGENGGLVAEAGDDIPTPIDASAAEVIAYYDRLVNLLGSRNEAFTRAGFWAFNHGWRKVDFTALLLERFVQTPPVTRHKAEKPESRRAEGIKTINSVFKPGRKRLNNTPAEAGEFTNGLPNTARKLLLQLSERSKDNPATCPPARHAARFIEIAYFNNWRVGRVFTVEQATELCKPFGMSRNPIQSLLTTEINGLRLFQKIENFQDTANALPENGAKAPLLSIVGFEGKEGFCTKMNSNTPHVYNNVIYSDQNRAKPQKGGRPPSAYVLPSIEYVCSVLGVDMGKSYPISAADLQSAKAYRSKFTEAFLDRYPGQYSGHFLAKRAGVSRATARRDMVNNPKVIITPQYERKPIHFDNLEKLIPADESLLGWGVWLETGELDAEGKPKRRRASQWNARKLLNQGLKVELVKQDKNHYDTTRAAGQLLRMAAGAENTTRYDASQMPYRGATKGIEAPSTEAPMEYTRRTLTPAEIESDSLFEYGMKSLGAVEITVGVETNE